MSPNGRVASASTPWSWTGGAATSTCSPSTWATPESWHRWSGSSPGWRSSRSGASWLRLSNLTDGAWWTRLHLTVLGQTMRYVVALQKVGNGVTGVLAVTVFSERLLPKSEADEVDAEPSPIPERLLTLSSNDSVTLVHTDTVEER